MQSDIGSVINFTFAVSGHQGNEICRI